MRTVVVLMDSLNRHMLKAYNKDTWMHTPNITNFSEDSVTFDNHWIGSTPCMPARRDLFTGRLNFLERNWGPIEPFDITLPDSLKANGIFTHMITDHYHYFELGGEGYCQIFDSWDLIRGQESDPVVSRVKKPDFPKEYYGRVRLQYELNRQLFNKEEDFPSPKTFASACNWINDNCDADNFFLMVEAFDPHEPFDCPQEYLDMYNDDYKGPRYDWPEYAPVNEPPEAVEHIRKRYAGTLTMVDKWFGKFIDTLKKHNMYEDTLIILTADHGHILGEHGLMAKNYMHQYNELAHIPLIIHLPKNERAGQRVNAITQNIDIMPTVLEYNEIKIPDFVAGFSLKPIIEEKQEKVRDVALYGYYGKAVNMTDGKYTYFRAPESTDNLPLNLYTAMPTSFRRFVGTENAGEIEIGRFLQYTNYPVFKIPQKKSGKGISHVMQSLIFDIENDYTQQNEIKDEEIEKLLIQKLIVALKDAQAPSEQFERLGLKI